MVDPDRLLGALVLGGTADALGWRNETTGLRSHRQHRAHKLEGWTKRIGRIGGYWERIHAGEYSDDTQLTLAVARCMSPRGTYDADKFAKVELPYWLTYQRGGGRTIKRAAASLARTASLTWDSNVFDGYAEAGANGAAMRVLALSIISDVDALTVATWRNAVTTHGHPRAIIGALVMAWGLHSLLYASSFSARDYLRTLRSLLSTLSLELPDDRLARWIFTRRHTSAFDRDFADTRQEMLDFVTLIETGLDRSDHEVMERLGCFAPGTRGSGTGTVAAGHYLFLKYLDAPERAAVEAANAYGADTDTIGKFTGNLLGMLHARHAYLAPLSDALQDRFYFERISNYLAGKEPPHWNGIGGDETEINEQIREGDVYHSAVLGYGCVDRVLPSRIVDRGTTKLLTIRVVFECGQTCYFNRRVHIDDIRQARLSMPPDVTRIG